MTELEAKLDEIEKLARYVLELDECGQTANDVFKDNLRLVAALRYAMSLLYLMRKSDKEDAFFQKMTLRLLEGLQEGESTLDTWIKKIKPGDSLLGAILDECCMNGEADA